MVENVKSGYTSFRCFLSLFLIMFLTSSYNVVYNHISNSVTILSWLFVGVIILFDFNGKLNLKLLYVVLALIGSMWITIFLNGEDIKVSVYITIEVIIALIFVSVYGFDYFKNIYIKIMEILCFLSLVLFLGYIVFPEANDYFLAYNSFGHAVSNLYIYVDSVLHTRNFGMFWEPGAFGVFINLALAFELTKEKINVKAILLFIITLITTFSTASFFSLAILMLYFIFDKNTIGTKARKYIIALIVAALLVAIFNYEYLFANVNSVFGKLQAFIEGRDSISVMARYWSVILAAQAFLKSPLLGVGYSSLKEMAIIKTGGDVVSCTVLNWFGVYGIIFGLIMTVGIVKICKNLGKKPIKTIYLFFFFFMLTLAEDFIHNAFFYLLVLYGYMIKPHELESDDLDRGTENA